MAESAVATVKGGFWEQYGSTVTQVQGTGALRRHIARMLSRKGVQDLRARMTALDGVAAGANATKTQPRVEPNVELGGKRTIETETLINRNTTAADIVVIEADVNTYSTRTTFGASPPANLDGNPLGTR